MRFGSIRARVGLLALVVAACACHQAGAQLIPKGASKQSTPLDRNQPVAFTADNFEYDRTNGIVTATGHVEAWQNDHVLRADSVTFDRNTNVAAASGNVVLVEPDGQVLFSDYAELTQGMREGVLKGMRTLLAENGKLVANGARRTDGKINELTRAVYTTCDLCKTDPSRPPLWQLRAYGARQDAENHRIEYTDAYVDIYGVPVAYLPYFAHADPSVRRASGFLVPVFGQISHIGQFLTVPYFWAIDEQSDLTVSPEITTGSGEQIGIEYRRRFNNGTTITEAAVAFDKGKPNGFVFSKGNFSYDETWRYGYNLNRASGVNYLRDFQVQNYSSVLTTSAFVEGFGVGAYTKLDAIAYQGLATSINQSRLPYVLPRYEYSFYSEVDPLGGRLRFDTVNFNVVREVGTNTQRAGASIDWQRPFAGELGEQYNVTIHADMAAYVATSLNQQPSYGPAGSNTTARAQPTIAAEMRWPFLRDGGASGSQIIEPIAQLVASPHAGSFIARNIPNEDSLDFEFTDANLFSINRFPGIDRFEGGLRANVGLHANWTMGETTVDGLVGQSFRDHVDKSFPPRSGLNRTISDVVGRVTVTPAKWLDFTARTRVDPRNASIRFGDVVTSAGTPLLRVSAGYLYSSTNPYFLYDQAFNVAPPTPKKQNSPYPASFFIPRNEITLGATTQFGRYKLTTYVRRNLQLNQFDNIGARGTYEDECFIFDVNFNKRYTSINNDHGGTSLLFQITLKTVGQFGFHG